MRISKRAVMTRAHQIRATSRVTMSTALSLAWREEKKAMSMMIESLCDHQSLAIQPQRLPLEAAMLGIRGIANKLKRSRVDLAIRIRLDAGLRITLASGHPTAVTLSSEIGSEIQIR